MRKKRIGIIFGGKSAEHEVSLQSAKNISEAIDKDSFEILLLWIDKKGKWYAIDNDQYLLNQDDPMRITLESSSISTAIVFDVTHGQLIDTVNCQQLPKIDVAFPIVHGTFGEDGSLQGMLRVANLPFVGSDILGSAICLDKDITKRLLRDAGLHVAPFVTLTRANLNRFTFTQISTKLGLPLFIKPASQGSSVGVSKVISEDQFVQAISLALKFDNKIIIEQMIVGREIECAVLGNDSPQASTCGEVIFNSDFYSYDTKYINDKCVRLEVPAILDPQINGKVRAIAIEAYRMLGCAGMARIDFFLTPEPENKLIINEINTLPGFTNTSMYPKLWQVSGLSYQDLITYLIELAIERHATDGSLRNLLNH